MESFFSGLIAFLKGKGFILILASLVVSIVRFLAVAMGVIRFEAAREAPLKRIIILLIFEIPSFLISLSIAILVGYMALIWFEGGEHDVFWMLLFAVLSGSIGNNRLSALINLKFEEKIQKMVDTYDK